MPVAAFLRASTSLLLLSLVLCLLGAPRARAADAPKPERQIATLTIDVSWSRSRQEVLVRAICAFTLPPHSRALVTVREKGAPYCDG